MAPWIRVTCSAESSTHSMEYYREGGSGKHLRDIAGILKVSGGDVDYSYVERWSARKGLMEIWRTVQTRSKDRS